MNRWEEERKKKEEEEAVNKLAALPPAMFYGCMFVSALFWQYVKHGDLFRGDEVWYKMYGEGFLLIVLTAAAAYAALFIGSQIFGRVYRDMDGDAIGWRIFRIAALLFCLVIFTGLVGAFF